MKAKKKSSTRPYVICHMVPSVDGRIVVNDWGNRKALSSEYEKTAQTFGADAWIIGRISMEPYAGKTRVPKRSGGGRVPRADFIVNSEAESYAIAIDPSGKLTWKSNFIDEEHVITVLTEQVSDDYVAFLQDKRVSHIFAGKKEIHLPTVLAKLSKYFGIEKLLLEGGGKINGSFLEADLIDELSLLVAPVADGTVGTPTLFDTKARPKGRKASARQLKLLSAEKRKGDLVWLRYQVR